MNQAAMTRAKPIQTSGANTLQFATESDKAFSKRALLVITMVMLLAWILTE